MFKFKSLTLACAAAVSTLAAGYAAAQDAPGACANAAVAEINLTGASATQNILGNIFTNLLDAGFTTVFSKAVGSVAAGTDYRAYCGTLKVAVGTLPVGTTVRFVNRAKGGSLWGVNPVARNTPIATLSFATADCVAQATPNLYHCAEVGDDLNGANPANRAPDFGISDLEPQVFGISINLADAPTAVSTALTSAELLKLDIRRGFAPIFGVVATDTIPNFSFTRANIGQILTGQASRWNTLGGAGTTTASNDRIVVVRREPGSGTQAASNQYFLDQPCARGNVSQSVTLTPNRQTAFNGGGAGTEGDPRIINPTVGLGPLVIEASTSGEVRNALIAARDGVNFKFQAPSGIWFQVNFAGNTWGAIAVLGIENQNNAVGIGTAAGSKASFRAINGLPAGGFGTGDQGAKPARDAAQVAAYDFVFENSFQTNKDNEADATFQQVKLPFINGFIALAQQEATLRSLGNANETAVLAIPGLAGNTTTAAVPTALDTANAGTARWTKSANTCAPFRSTR